jgi:hypothetical protein
MRLVSDSSCAFRGRSARAKGLEPQKKIGFVPVLVPLGRRTSTCTHCNVWRLTSHSLMFDVSVFFCSFVFSFVVTVIGICCCVTSTTKGCSFDILPFIVFQCCRRLVINMLSRSSKAASDVVSPTISRSSSATTSPQHSPGLSRSSMSTPLFAHVEDENVLIQSRTKLVSFCIEHSDVVGALGQCLSKSESRGKLYKLFEEITLRLAEKNEAVLGGLLRVELFCAKDVSTLMRGNSVVSRCVVAVLKGTVGLCKIVEEWTATTTLPGGGHFVFSLFLFVLFVFC